MTQTAHGAVLDTTLAPPPLPADAVRRPRLETILDRALECDVTVVTAPPGAGKTVLVAQWLAGRPKLAVSWLTVVPADNDPVQFWRHFLSAMAQVAPGASRRGLELLDTTRHGLPPDFLTILLNDLAALPDDVVLVLDDLHNLSDPAVIEALGFLGEHLPLDVHVVACTREDPAFPLHRLRVRGRLLEIGQALLRFDHAESDEFLRSRGSLDEGDRRVIEERTEGWVAGLRLALDHPAGTGIAGRSAAELRGDVADYLRRELVLGQSDEIRQFLAATSVPAVFCAPLCDALTGREDSEEILRSLERSNLFILPVGDGGWYRYHRLFRDLLQRELAADGPGRTAALHAAAGKWCERNEHFAAAVEHYLTAGDTERAHDLLYRRASSGGWDNVDAVLRWLEAMPSEFLGADVQHIVRTAAILLWSGEAGDARRWLELAQARVHDGSEQTPDNAVLAAAWCWYHEMRGAVSEAVLAGRRAIALAPGGIDDDDVLAQVPALLVRAHAALDNFVEARASFVRLPAMVHVSEVRRGAIARAALAWVAFREGQLRGALDLAEGALALDDTDGVAAGFARLTRGAVLAERGEPATAELELDAAVEAADRFRHPVLGALARGELASLWRQSGRTDDAVETLAQARRVSPPFALPARVAARLRLIQARVLLDNGDLDSAAKLGMTSGKAEQSMWQARLALVRGDHSDAVASLKEADREAETLRALLEVAVLRAAVLLDAGDPAGATAVAAAAALAEPEGFVEIFLSEGDRFMSAVRRVVAADPSPYLYLLLSLHEDRRERPAPELPALVGTMSDRERIVLRYLQGRLSNVEIAKELSISTNTLKTHLKSIYRKLGATSRTEAIAQARKLRLL